MEEKIQEILKELEELKRIITYLQEETNYGNDFQRNV